MVGRRGGWGVGGGTAGVKNVVINYENISNVADNETQRDKRRIKFLSGGDERP